MVTFYGVMAIRLREQVIRNAVKFPSHFMFRLTADEVKTMVSQNAIPSIQQLGGSLPYVFAEHGILQLANVLKSGKATQMSIRIIEVFVKMREMFTDNTELRLDIEQIKHKLGNHSKNIELVFQYLDELLDKKNDPKPRTQIGYKITGKS